MNQEEFVEAIRVAVLENGIRSVQSNLARLPGRQPSEKMIATSNWYNALGDGDKKIVIQIIMQSARTAVFGFLCVLDGIRAIEDEDKGELKLYYEKGDFKILLNDPHNPSLHEFL